MPKQYIVREGDSISSIAFENGFYPNTIWEHPENARLRQERTVGTCLKEGDVVFIPDLQRKTVSKSTEAEHVFRVKGTPEKMKIRFLDEKSEPRSGRRYVISIDGSLREGKTDGDGFVSEYIPPASVNVKLTIFEDGFEDEYNLKVGYLAPITEISGVLTRLSHLGYPVAGEEESEGQMQNSLVEFQKDYGLDPSGKLDLPTRNKIKEVYGA